jgi:hypothetical protein
MVNSSTENLTFHHNLLNIKNQLHMTLETHVLAWHKYKNVARLSHLMGSQSFISRVATKLHSAYVLAKGGRPGGWVYVSLSSLTR